MVYIEKKMCLEEARREFFPEWNKTKFDRSEIETSPKSN
jgi:hypothetical protein